MNERAVNRAPAKARPNTATVLRVWLPLALGVAVLFAANAQLIYVATKSQPPCVTHALRGEGNAQRGVFSAAQSSCTPPQADQAISEQGEAQWR
jgi:hypothetical protein